MVQEEARVLKKVFVTGGAGFIGNAVVRRLLACGYSVTAYDDLSTGAEENLPKDEALNLFVGDVEDFETTSLAIKGHEYVVHLAAQAFIPVSYNYSRSVAKTNALGSLNVFQACLNNRVKRIVHVSSSEIYGSATYTPMDELHPLNPRSTYAVSKLAGDLWAQTMAYEHNLPVVVLRPFNAFGPRDTCPRFIPEAVRQCLKASAIEIGNLATSRDFTYVEDVAAAIVLALENERIDGEVINIGTGKSLKMSEILEMIEQETGNENKEVVEDQSRFRRHDVTLLMANFKKASTLLGWKPEVEFAEGLQKTIDWYCGNGMTWGYERHSMVSSLTQRPSLAHARGRSRS
jgi:nucleoside-diphosphate-sugar epimerase